MPGIMKAGLYEWMRRTEGDWLVHPQASLYALSLPYPAASFDLMTDPLSPQQTFGGKISTCAGSDGCFSVQVNRPF